MRACGAQQAEAVRLPTVLRLMERFFMAEDDAFGIAVEMAEGEESAALQDTVRAQVCSRIGIGHAEPLRVSVDAGLLFPDEDALLPPGG